MFRTAVARLAGLLIVLSSSAGCIADMHGYIDARIEPHGPHNAPTSRLPPQAPEDTPPPQRPGYPKPVFYQIPLSGAQDVVFVLDNSGSMSEATATSHLSASGPVAMGTGLVFVGLDRMRPVMQGGNPVSMLPGAVAAVQSPTKMEAAKSELISSITCLPDGTRFSILFFSNQVRAFSSHARVMDHSSRASAVMFVAGIAPEDMTAAVPALRVAYQNNPRRVVFLSDGLPNVGGDRDQLLAEARIQMARGVRFDTVGVGRDQDGPLMQALAQESGGIVVSR